MKRKFFFLILSILVLQNVCVDNKVEFIIDQGDGTYCELEKSNNKIILKKCLNNLYSDNISLLKEDDELTRTIKTMIITKDENFKKYYNLVNTFNRSCKNNYKFVYKMRYIVSNNIYEKIYPVANLTSKKEEDLIYVLCGMRNNRDEVLFSIKNSIITSILTAKDSKYILFGVVDKSYKYRLLSLNLENKEYVQLSDSNIEPYSKIKDKYIICYDNLKNEIYLFDFNTGDFNKIANLPNGFIGQYTRDINGFNQDSYAQMIDNNIYIIIQTKDFKKSSVWWLSLNKKNELEKQSFFTFNYDINDIKLKEEIFKK